MIAVVLIVLTVIAVAAIALAAASVRVLREYERAVVFRLGRVIEDKGPGLVLLIPAVDRMVRVTLRTITLRPRGGVPALEAELFDGSGVLTVIWLGRRRIAGIAPGRSMRVTGRIGRLQGVRTMYNPRYELLP